MTVIVIPQSGKRSLSFQLSPGILKAAAVALVLGVGALGVVLYHNRNLRNELATLNRLKQINQEQQAEIQSMTWKVQRTDEQLNLLGRLEEQLRKFTRQAPLPLPPTDGAVAPQTTKAGRWGPHSEPSKDEPLPILSAFLPQDMRQYIFGRFDPAVSHATESSPETVLSLAKATNDRLSVQLEAAHSWENTLTREQMTITAQLDFLAHLPSGFPVQGARLTDGFGSRWSPFGWGKQFHAGIDLAQESGRTVTAAAAGKVIHAGWKSGGYGYTVMLDHGYGFSTLYGHLQDWSVTIGQSVTRGDPVGRVGNTGDSTGPHLHYEVHQNGEAVDPMLYTR